MKLLILIIGKERVLEHLKKNAGAEDILDSLIATYGQVQAGQTHSMIKARLSAPPDSNKTKKKTPTVVKEKLILKGKS